jgi:hypothetical protein
MCSLSGTPHGLERVKAFARLLRDFVAVCTVSLSFGLLIGSFFVPNDIERAEADLAKARAIVCALDRESDAQQEETVKHKERASEHQRIADKNKDTTDLPWLEWNRAMADGHSQIGRAKRDRRDNLTHLTAVYLRLLAEAESEILRAKDARDRGTPYKVAPRVHEILAPILSEH